MFNLSWRNSFSYDVTVSIDFSGNSSLLENLIIANGQIVQNLIGYKKTGNINIHNIILKNYTA